MSTVPTAPTSQDKFGLWVGGSVLRGAHIYQRRVYPELDETAEMGDNPVGPPYTRKDLRGLRDLGANYVDISHPGLFAEEPPYRLDRDMQASLDRLLELAAQVGLFAVISFRTGPGRSEFGFHLDEVGTWFDDGYLNDAVWEDAEAQDAWAEMWIHTAERYRDNPTVIGYRLMVEPNANTVVAHTEDPTEFYPEFSEALADWNPLALSLTAAVRQVDALTPLLVDPMNGGSLAWLPALRPTGDARTIYRVRLDEPRRFLDATAGSEGEARLTYPGRFQPDLDGATGPFDSDWLAAQMAPVNEFFNEHGFYVDIGTFRVPRWQEGAADYFRDLIEVFEANKFNYGLWLWGASRGDQEDAFNIRRGPDPDNHDEVGTSDLLKAVADAWARNNVRPDSS